ncbi:MAG: sensor histidine kinase [Agathobacter sp.]
MNDRRFHVLHTPKVKKQVLWIFLVAAIIPITVVGIFSILQVRKQMLTHYEKQLKAEGIRVNSLLFDITTSMYTTSESILSSKNCMLTFGKEEPVSAGSTEYEELSASLAALKNNNAAVSTLKIYTDNPNIPNSAYISSVSSYEEYPWYSILEEKEWNAWGCVETSRLRQDYYELTLVRRIGVVSRKYSAYFVLQIDNNYMKNRIDQNEYQILSTVNEYPVFYTNVPAYMQQELPFPDEYPQSYYSYNGPLTLSGEQQLSRIVSFQSYGTNDIFYICVSAADGYRDINQVTVSYVLITLIALLVPAVIILLFSTIFSKRVNTLKHAMHQASEGDYNLIDQLKGDDELSEAFADLKRTVEQIHEKESRIYEAQIKEQLLVNRQQQMEYKMLSSQINPHFLYNTLETIRMQSLSAGNREVATSIKLLGKAMRYVLDNTGTNFTTLDKELSYIETYLSIQKLRFGDRISTSIEIDPGIDPANYQILPLLLQPIVENAIVHGLEGMTSLGYAKIHIALQDTMLLITVSDNGCGMDEKTLAQIRNSINNHDPEDAHSIGLYNINQRIKLCYGEEYDLEIDSKPNEGVTVTLHLPARNVYKD